jgi:bifunctional UDP-N-acetylglucosamine pyrophosphorylase/glucosamine-1-phosphate N-acetyltransferase
VEDLKNFNIDDDFSYVAGLAHEEPQNYGVLKVGADNFLEKIIEKPKEFCGKLINTGLYKFSPEVFSYLDKISLSPRGEYELTDVINILAEKNKIKVLDLQGAWLDFGKPNDIIRVEEYLKNHDKKNN